MRVALVSVLVALVAAPAVAAGGSFASYQAQYLAEAAEEERSETHGESAKVFEALAEKARTSGPVTVADLPAAWRTDLVKGGSHAKLYFALMKLEEKLRSLTPAVREANAAAVAHATVDAFHAREELSERRHFYPRRDLVEHGFADLANLKMIGDRDGDGIMDDKDACPDSPEDKDGFEDADGCPEAGPVKAADRDGDGIPDGTDRCPDAKEDMNSILDDDGCPDTLVAVRFPSDSAALTAAALDTLKANYEILVAATRVRVRLEGYADSTNTDDHNRSLGLRRAQAVKKYLTETMGLPADRFDTETFGEEKPVADNSTPEGRAMNRRVEFVVVAR